MPDILKPNTKAVVWLLIGAVVVPMALPKIRSLIGR